MKAHVFYVFLCFLIDGILAVLFPNSYLLDQMMFIPCLGFSAMVLTIREMDLINACLFACCFGIFYDFFYAQTFAVNAVIFTIIALIVHTWSRHMTETIVELLVLCISTIFVKELMVYIVMSLQSVTDMSLTTWFINREFLTLIFNVGLALIVVFLLRIKDDYLEIRDRRIRREEHIQWTKLSSKR